MTNRLKRSVITGCFIVFSVIFALNVHKKCDYKYAGKIWLLVFVVYLIGMLLTFKKNE